MSPEIAVAADLWSFYFSETIQDEASYFSFRRAFEFLEAPTTTGIYVSYQSAVGYLKLRVLGRCKDGGGSFDIEFNAEDLDDEEKKRIYRAVKRFAPSLGLNHQKQRKTVATSLSLPREYHR